MQVRAIHDCRYGHSALRTQPEVNLESPSPPLLPYLSYPLIPSASRDDSVSPFPFCPLAPTPHPPTPNTKPKFLTLLVRVCDSPDSPLRFIQMWIVPSARGLTPNYGSACGTKV